MKCLPGCSLCAYEINVKEASLYTWTSYDSISVESPFVITEDNLWKVVYSIEASQELDFCAIRFIVVMRHLVGKRTVELGFSDNLFKYSSAKALIAKELNWLFVSPQEKEFLAELLSSDPWPGTQLDPSQLGEPSAPSASQVVADLARMLPDLLKQVLCPACYAYDLSATLQRQVQHLNDAHQWTREAIADWLETLDVDLSFPTEAPSPRPDVESSMPTLEQQTFYSVMSKFSQGLEIDEYKYATWLKNTMASQTYKALVVKFKSMTFSSALMQFGPWLADPELLGEYLPGTEQNSGTVALPKNGAPAYGAFLYNPTQNKEH